MHNIIIFSVVDTDSNFSQSPLYQNQEEDPRVASIMWNERYGLDDDSNDQDDDDEHTGEEDYSDENDEDDEDVYMHGIFNWYVCF